MKSLFSDKGVAAVEMALILPLLLALTFGLIEFGLFMYNQQVLTNAAREGARAGIRQTDPAVPRKTAADIRQVVTSYLRPPDGAGPWRLVTFNTNPNPSIQAPTVCIGHIWPDSGQVTVNISLSTPYLVADNLVALLSLGAVTLPPITLSTESVMECE